MNKISLSRLLFAMFILVSCSESQTADYSDFTDKKPQSETERTVRELTAVDSLLVGEDIPELSLSYLELSTDFVFSMSDEHIVKLDKEDLGREQAIAIPEGRGPGEAPNFRLVTFLAGPETLAFYDRNTQKTMIYDLNGAFREEFTNGGYQPQPLGIEMADTGTWYFQIFPTPDHEHIFYEVVRQGSESSIRRRFQEPTEGRNLLAYRGSLASGDGALFFGGRSEPVIRRYSLSGENVELAYSRAVIDDYESELNYDIPEQQESTRRWSYSDQAQYATVDLATDGRFLYSARHPNDRKGYKYLDVYSAGDGDYLVSFPLGRYPQYVAVDDEHIYTLEEEGDRSYLMKYEKPVIE